MYLKEKQWGGGINSCVRLGLVEVKYILRAQGVDVS